MKKMLFSLLALVFIAASCDSDDNNSTISESDVVNTVTSGTWRVTAFTEDGTDHTGYFTNYNFTFGASNVLTATNGTNTYTGIWSVTSDDSDDDSSDDSSSDDLDFNIFFSSPDNFTEISEDWSVLERTSTKLRLKHTSGGDGSVDFLTFEKNS